MIRRTEDSHIKAAREVFDDPERMAQLEEAFEDFPDRVYQNMWTRRQLGDIGELQSLRRWQGSADLVGRLLQDRISEGLSADDAASRIMRGLVQGDEQLEQIARDYGPRGGLTQDALERGVEFDEDAARIARQIGNDARRISRSEMASAYHEADVEASRRSPSVKGVRWTLSSAHPQTDECDVLAEQDAYGLGPGIYPPDKVPSLPHPNCKCSTRMELWDPSEFGNELDTGDPDLPTESQIADMLGEDATEAQKQRVLENARNQTSRFA
jgi:hypothetical protein